MEEYDRDFHYYANEKTSPFELNMDTLQASIFRLSMADLALKNGSTTTLHSKMKQKSKTSLHLRTQQRRQSWSHNSWGSSSSLNKITSIMPDLDTQHKHLKNTANNKTRNTVRSKARLNKLIGSQSVESQLSSVSVHSLAQTSLVEKTELTLSMLPGDSKISPLSPSYHPPGLISLSVSPRFNWRQLETAVSGTSEEQLLCQLSQLQQAVSQGAAARIRQLGEEGLDLGLPLRGQTALYLSVILSRSDMTREILRQMMKQKTVARNINMFSVDNASRRETALICAARTGQLDCVRYLLNYGADTELRDGEGHTALWCAVREQREDMVTYLVTRGARVWYRDNDHSCPLQLACKTPLLKESGQRIACHLVVHGANLEYQDIALRNTLFWVVYNNNRDLAYFIIQCGARVRPWSWMESQHLPEPLRQDKLLLNMIRSASRQPQKLVLICVNSVRKVLSECEGGRSIVNRIDKLPCQAELKKIVRFECATTKREQDIRKLHRLQETTEV